MTGKQHMTIGTFGATILSLGFLKVSGATINPIALGAVVAGAAIGSYMPDIDSKKSKASQLFNKIVLGFILFVMGSNVISGVTGLTFIKDLMELTSGSIISNIGLVLFAGLSIAGKLSPHRQFTHKWLGTLAFCLVSFIAFKPFFAVGFSIGYLLHILGDRTTKAGKHLNFFELKLPCQNSKGKFKPVF